MKWLKDLRQTVDVARGAKPPDLSRLSPRQRARAEQNVARVHQAQVEAQESYEEAAAIGRVAKEARILQGPAADYLYGAGDPGPRMSQFKQALRQTFDRGGPPEEEDPAERARIAAAERAERDAARAPYLAPEPPPIHISRLATRGRSQVRELIAYLQQSGLAARPDLVYGVYRVPDRISPTLSTHSESGRVVEWDIVHVPGALPPADVAVEAVLFGAREQWLARRIGEPSVVDEELGALYCTWAGIGPEACLGIARFPSFRAAGWTNQDLAYPTPVVEGVYVLHAPTAAAGEMVERMTAHAPLSVGAGDLRQAHVELLDFFEISRVVHPQAHKPARVPSPMPYLPSTAQELLRAYLEIVGVSAADCFSAQATIDEPLELSGSVGLGSTNVGPKLPCADGKPRGRLHGARQVVVAYRDRPAYGAGRERWAAYQRDVLQARLDHASGVRAPLYVDDDSDVGSAVLRAGLGALRAIDRAYDAIDLLGADAPPPPFRYCWPPVVS